MIRIPKLSNCLSTIVVATQRTRHACSNYRVLLAIALALPAYANAATKAAVTASSLPAAAAQCALAEGGTCTFLPGTVATVYYGGGSSYLALSSSNGSIPCNYVEFGGDPAPGVYKACYAVVTSGAFYADFPVATGARSCAAENGACAIPAGSTATVYYGIQSAYLVKTGISGSVACSNSSFGADPDPGIVKSCYIAPATATLLPSSAAQCALAESGSCTFSSGTLATVYYGASSGYFVLSGVSGNVPCNVYEFGGDPAYGLHKACYAVVSAGTAQSITFGVISAQTVGVPLTLSATASSGLAVAYSASPSSVCTVSNATATFTAAGTCAITASQAGNGTYAAAVPVSESFTVQSSSAPPVTGPFGAVRCASAESGTCAVPAGATETVYYGANNSFLVRNGVAGSIGCNQTAFGGNPNPGVAQACYAATASSASYSTAAMPAGAQQCALEAGTCVLSTGTTATVYYGAGNNYFVKLGMTGSVPCSYLYFGGDPAPYVLKSCYAVVTSNAGSVATNILPFGSTACAIETGTCTVPNGSSANVFYGANNSYLFKSCIAGSIPCAYSYFGLDPAPGIAKACYIATPAQPAFSLSLSPSFNVAAIASDGSAFSSTMFNQGYASLFSQTALGSQLIWNGSLFTFGPPNVPNAVSNTSVVLPPGNYGRLDFLAARISGNNSSENFTITYTDGSSTVVTQGMSDWGNNSPGNANYPNESTVAYMGYLNNSSGNSSSQVESLYGYTFNLNPAKTVSKLTLPADSSVGVLAMNLGAPNVAPAIPTAGTPISVLTHHNDSWRTGMNSNEYQLTPATVANVTGTNVFGKLGTIALDEAVDAQPLVVPNISVAGDPNAGSHDVVYVGTRNNTIYAIDPVRLSVLAQRNLGAPVANPLGAFNQGASGLRGTPVIDTSKGAIYAVAYVQTANSGPQYILHMLSLSTLADLVNPVTVAATGQTTTGTMSFNATYEMQRPALLESGGNIFVAFGSWGDLSADKSRGWVLSFNASTLQPNTAATDLLNKLGPTSSNNYFLSSVWMSGAGPAADEGGDLYFSTGNSGTGTYDGVNNVQESVVKLNPLNGQLMSIYTPNDEAILDAEDKDLGAGGVLLLPDATKRVGAIMGKDGIVRVFDRDNLGGNNDANLVTAVDLGEFCGCSLSYFNDGQDRLVTSGGTHLRVFSWLTGQTPGLSLQATTAIPNGLGLSSIPPGAFTSISSGGSSNGIIWVAAAPNVLGTKGVNLLAFQATPVNGMLPLLYLAPAGGWLAAWGGAYHTPPTIANGKVYVASQKQLFVFGFGGVR